MKRIAVVMTVLGLAGLCLAACAPQDDSHWNKAFPEENVLKVPVSDTGQQTQGLSSLEQALVGDRADLHDLSFLVAFQINRQVEQILTTLWFVTRFEPSASVLEEGVIGEGEDEFHYDARAMWGPFPDDEGKDLEFILHAWRGVDDEDGRLTYIYFVAARPEGGTDDEWQVILLGGAKPFEGHEDRLGMVQLDMNTIQTLDPTEDDTGIVSFVYYQKADSHVVAAVGEGVWADDEHTTRTDATYFYGLAAEGYAVMEFDMDGNMDEAKEPALEHLHVSTGWLLANGNGRSDAVVSGGDLGELNATLTECWGSDLKQTYFHWFADSEPPLEVEDGESSACFIDQAIVIDVIDYQDIRDAFE